MDEQIQDRDWDIILRRISENRCVPFLGAAVNASTSGYKGAPLGDEVATRWVRILAKLEDDDLKELAQAMRLIKELKGLQEEDLKDLAQAIARLKEERQSAVYSVEHDLAQVIMHHKLVERGLDKDLSRLALQNLARVALHAEVVYRWDYDYFITVLRSIIADAGLEPSKLLRTLAQMPWKLIVSTNYDRLMERALEEIPVPYEPVEQPINGFTPEEQVDLQKRLSKPDGVIVYKLHGTFPDVKSLVKEEIREGAGVSTPEAKKKSSRIIITEDDYIKFLTVVGKEDGGVPNLIKNKIIDGTLLFLGYSLEDWDFRTLFKGLIEPLDDNDKRVSFAIQKSPPDFWRDFWHKKGVVIYDLDVYKFAEQLKEKWERYPH